MDTRDIRRLKKIKQRTHEAAAELDRELAATRVDSQKHDTRHLLREQKRATGLSYVSWRQRLLDRCKGVLHAIAGLHKSGDVFLMYEKDLQGEVEALKARFPDLGDATDLRIRELHQIIAHGQELCKRLGAITPATSEPDIFTSIEQELQEEKKQSLTEYEKWFHLLHRPAYFERFENFAEQYKAALSDKQEPETRHWTERLLQDVPAVMGRLLSLYGIPLFGTVEIAFAYAAFALLTPDEPYLTLAAATTFSIALIVAGQGLAHCVTRAFPKTIEQTNGRSYLKTGFRVQWGLSALCCLGIGLGGTIFGAELRSKVPQATVWAADRKKILDGREEAARLRARAIGEGVEGAKQQLSQSEKTLTDHDAKRKDILKLTLWDLTADKLVAFTVYVAIVLCSFLKIVLLRDPHKEYDLIARWHRAVLETLQFISLLRNMRDKAREEQKKQVEDQVLAARAELTKLSPHDAWALRHAASESAHSNGHVSGRSEAYPHLYQPDMRSRIQAIRDHWVQQRVRRYVRWYLIVRPTASTHPKTAASLQRITGGGGACRDC